MARVSLRVIFTDESALGPGKVRLLELIAEMGSISGAGRAIGMSYHRAWDLVAELNKTFRDPLVASKPGGSRGSELTPTGAEIIRRYRAIEASVTVKSGCHIDVLEQMIVASKRKRH